MMTASTRVPPKMGQTGALMKFPEFRDKLQRDSFTVIESSGDHGKCWQVTIPGSGAVLNYYPDSHRKTLHVDRRGKGANQIQQGLSPHGVIDFAHRLWEQHIGRQSSTDSGGCALNYQDATDLKQVYGGQVVQRDGIDDAYTLLIQQPDGTALAMAGDGVRIFASPAHFQNAAPPLASIRIDREMVSEH